MKGKGKKVLLVYDAFTAFVNRDYKFLENDYNVDRYQYGPAKGMIQVLLSFIKQFLFLIIKGRQYKFYYIWFADQQAFLPVFFAKIYKVKTYVVIGGHDAAALPNIGFGIQSSNRIRRYFNKYILKYSDWLLPVDGSLVNDVNAYQGEQFTYLIGIENVVKNRKGQILVVPSGFDSEIFKRDISINRKAQVLCVAGVKDDLIWQRKGVDLLVQIANEIPETEIHVYGFTTEFLNRLKNEDLPDNFYCHGYVQEDNLWELYNEYKVYAQLSLSEGLPNALCEAMLCECIPVGSSVNGIPNAIGDAGFILKEKNLDQAVELIRQALNHEGDLGVKARERIIAKFPKEARETTLSSLFTYQNKQSNEV